jgi:hypothetical protein
MGESAERSGFQAEGQARIRGGMSAVVLRSKRGAKRESAAKAKATALRTRGKSPVSDNSGREAERNQSIGKWSGSLAVQKWSKVGASGIGESHSLGGGRLRL